MKLKSNARPDQANWIVKALVTSITLAVGFLTYLLTVWVLALLGLPSSWNWLPVVLGPIIVGIVYIAALFTSLGKYLINLPPGSLG